MMRQQQKKPITDWDQAYDNQHAVGMAAVEDYVDHWAEAAKAFRDEMTGRGRVRLDQPYGNGARQRFDLFMPNKVQANGLAVFVHGGYWRTFDKSYWSHLANGGLEHGFAVALPSYSLCPEVRISDITTEIANFLTKVASEVDGPIHLAGHSAGGHLVASILLDRGPLDPALFGRVTKVVSISGVHDLRPLLKTTMNETLNLDLTEARAESPALHEPIDGTDLTCWVGGDELPAFREQNALLANTWHGLGARTEIVEAQGKHHFSVIESLADPESALTRCLLCKT